MSIDGVCLTLGVDLVSPQRAPLHPQGPAGYVGEPHKCLHTSHGQGGSIEMIVVR